MCTFVNEADSLSCTTCGAYPPGSWECMGCNAWNPEHALKCSVCDTSLVLQTGGWLCKACVPHEPVAQGELMCLQGHQQDGRIYGRGRRGANTVPMLQTQGDPPCKRPKVAGCAPECNGGGEQELDEETGQPEDPAPAEPEGLVAASKANVQPSLIWQDQGHAWLDTGTSVLRMFGKIKIRGTVVAWLPPGADPEEDPALWHVKHDDGDEEDLDEKEIEAGIQALADNTPASAKLDAGFSSAEMKEAMRSSLHKARQAAEKQRERYQLLGDKLLLIGLYIIDVAGDGSCQFEALRVELNRLNKNPPSTAQDVRVRIVQYMVKHKDCFEEGQQMAFDHGDEMFKEAVLSEYDDYSYDRYCELMLNPPVVKANCEWGDVFTLKAASDIWEVNVMLHCMDPQGGYYTTHVNEINNKWKTLHLAHFQSQPMHYAATGGHCLNATVAAVEEHNDGLLEGGSPEYLALVQMYDEHVKAMCASLFLDNRYKQGNVHSQLQVVDRVTAMLDMNKMLNTADTMELQSRAGDTATSELNYLQTRLELNKMMMYTVTQAVINRSHEEKMEQWLGSSLLQCGKRWTWGHHEHLIWVKSKLTCSRSYSVKSPVDLMRLLGNADRHLGRFYLHVTPLKALLDMYPAYTACDSADSTVAQVSTVTLFDCVIAATSKWGRDRRE